jgi:drug/metabolite transporter (DMT)-like permease
VLQTLSYRFGSTHVVAPVSYSSLVFAVAIGWAAFGRLPDAWSWAGLLVIGGAGVAGVVTRR